jgi:hemolysin activation/secretion protein
VPAASNQPLSAIAIERDFRLLAEDPAIRTVNADLRPGARPGEASLLLTVTPQDRFDIYLSAANSRSPSWAASVSRRAVSSQPAHRRRSSVGRIWRDRRTE